MAATAQVTDRILTVPNVLSFIRLLLVPVFLWLILIAQDGWALLVLVISSVSDYFDGLIARRFGLITKLGQQLDPLADRLFIFAAVIGLTARGILPWWLLAVIVGRDLMLVVLGIVLANLGYGPLRVHHLGKAATFFLFYALPVLMLAEAFPAIAAVAAPIGWAFALWGAFLYWWAGAVYVAEVVRLARLPRVPAGSASVTLEP